MQFKALSYPFISRPLRPRKATGLVPNSPVRLESLERREFLSVSTSPVAEPLIPTSAIVAKPAAAASSLDGTYTGVALVSLGKAPVSTALKVTIADDGTSITGSLALSKYYTFKINSATTFVKTSKHFWTAQVAGFTGDMAIRVQDTGAITVSANFQIPLLRNLTFVFTGQKAPNASPAVVVARPLDVTPSPMIASYNGVLSTSGGGGSSYVTNAVIEQAKGANLKLINKIKIATFGSLVGTFVFPTSLTNRFTLTLGKSSSGQTQSVAGQLDKRKNLELTFFDPPLATLSGSLTRVKH